MLHLFNEFIVIYTILYGPYKNYAQSSMILNLTEISFQIDVDTGWCVTLLTDRMELLESPTWSPPIRQLASQFENFTESKQIGQLWLFSTFKQSMQIGECPHGPKATCFRSFVYSSKQNEHTRFELEEFCISSSCSLIILWYSAILSSKSFICCLFS